MNDQGPTKLDEDDLAAVVGGSLSAGDTKSVGTFHGDLGDMAKAFEAMAKLASEMRADARELRPASREQSGQSAAAEDIRARAQDAQAFAIRGMSGLSTGASEALAKFAEARGAGGLGSIDKAMLTEMAVKFGELQSVAEAGKIQGVNNSAEKSPLSDADFVQHMTDIIKDMREKLQSIQNSDGGTLKSILRA